MSNILVLNQPFPSVGLSSYTFTCPTTWPGGYAAGSSYNVDMQVTVPSAVATGDGAGSGGVGFGGQGPAVSSSLVIVVAQNSVTKYTTPVITPTQGAQQFKTDLVCSPGDVITVTPSSSNPADNQLNSISMQCAIAQGA
jgi:hypothetical protein